MTASPDGIYGDKVSDLLVAAFKEDFGCDNISLFNDPTTRAVFGENTAAKALIKSKESGVLSGAKLIIPAFRLLDSKIAVRVLKSDGDKIENGAVIAEIQGDIHTILTAERTVLNLLQRLSGIASATNCLAKKIAHTKAKITDTRKTTPTLRFLEKEAALHGGGVNHRFGLYDMVLIKDTHVFAAGGPDIAVKKLREKYAESEFPLKIEVEVQSLQEFDKALSQNPDRIMLDNMSIDDMARAVKMRDGLSSSVQIEASGNVNEANVVSVAETGVDFISVGAITHSVKSLDIHLKIV